MTTEFKRESKARNAAKLARSVEFEQRLGVAAYRDARSLAAADGMIAGITRACIPAFDAANAAHQQKYASVFGRDPQRGAWSAGQVGNDFATVLAAATTGNLRERMTAIYNAGREGFKQEVVHLIHDDLGAQMDARGLDRKKLERRKRQMKLNPLFAKDVYRDPGNPFDRKHLGSYERRGETRIENPDDQKQSKRKVGDLRAAGVELSEREQHFMYQSSYDNQSWLGWMLGADPVAATEPLKWKEGGTWYRPDLDNKWVKKVQDKLHMPVVAGPSGTALRLFQAWEWLSKPVAKEHFRLALLGWMLTSNDHSFHEIMLTSSEYGLPYEGGLAAYHDVAPLTEAELRTIAGPEGFPDEQNYKADHMVTGQINSPLVTEQQLARFQALVNSDVWAAGRPPQGGQLAHAMAVLVYTDEGETAAGVSAYKFINNVLKGNENAITMYWHLRKEGALKDAYDANKFNIKQLVAEAKLQADYMQKGLQLLKPCNDVVYRGYRTTKLPHRGEAWSESKFLSTSTEVDDAKPFLDKGAGKYRVLASMQSVTGRHIGEFSMFPENEVIFPRGSQFSVANDPEAWPAQGEHTYKIRWTNHG